MRVADALLKRVGGPAKHRRRLYEVVLQQPGLGQRGPDPQLVLAIERGGPEQGYQLRGRVSPTAAFKRRRGPGERGVKSSQGHSREYTKYTRLEVIIFVLMSLAAHGVTHQGRRTTNEDAFLVDADRGLFIVADGMGGHNAGEVASSLAVKTIGEFLSDGPPASLNALDEALRLANDHILTVAGEKPDYVGMGTTVAAVYVGDHAAVYAHAGDSRVYLWHSGRLKQLTRDDSWVAAAMNGSAEDAREIEQHPMRHVLTKVVGLRPELQPSVAECPFEPGDLLLICSDGVHGSVNDETLSELLASRKPVPAVAESVVRQALAHGATDNVTAVVIRRD